MTNLVVILSCLLTTVIILSKSEGFDAERRVSGLSSVRCEGGNTECPSKTTCCKLKSGDFGCCPFENAVCCSDRTHCCPTNYSCDSKTGHCEKSSAKSVPTQWHLTQPWSPHIAARDLDLPASADLIKCLDGEIECFTNNTCCKDTKGGYGCCPSVNATCCADLIHCCPSGTTCDLQGHTCREVKPSAVSGGLQKIIYLVRLDNPPIKCHADSVLASNNEQVNVCPKGTTCNIDGVCV